MEEVEGVAEIGFYDRAGFVGEGEGVGVGGDRDGGDFEQLLLDVSASEAGFGGAVSQRTGMKPTLTAFRNLPL